MSPIRPMGGALFFFLALAACGQAAAPPAPPAQPVAEARTPIQSYRVVATYPHDRGAFTQGLFYLDGALYESTGQIGQSTIRRVNIEDGQVLQSTPIPPGQFGEGIVNWGDQIISLTWQGGIGYRWDRATLRRLGEWRYPGEGWGLTQNGRDIIMSDGTAELRFLDPDSLAERRRLLVTDQGQLIRTRVGQVRLAGRNTQGVTIFRTSASEHVVSVERLADQGEDDVEAAAPDAGDDGAAAPETGQE